MLMLTIKRTPEEEGITEAERRKKRIHQRGFINQFDGRVARKKGKSSSLTFRIEELRVVTIHGRVLMV
jgi:hypothetical protein